jgi:hypothetical protein
METSGWLHTPADLPLEKKPQVPMNKSFDGPQCQARHFGSRQKYLSAIPQSPILQPSHYHEYAIPAQVRNSIQGDSNMTKTICV